MPSITCGKCRNGGNPKNVDYHRCLEKPAKHVRAFPHFPQARRHQLSKINVLPMSRNTCYPCLRSIQSPRGGVAARSSKCCEASFKRADGVVRNFWTTPSAPIKGCLRRYLLRSRPPLLWRRGLAAVFTIVTGFVTWFSPRGRGSIDPRRRHLEGS